MVQWESRQQALLGYIDGMMGESLGADIGAILEANDLGENGIYALHGDNLSGVAAGFGWALENATLATKVVLRERLKAKLWRIQHVPGAELAADLLTKVITQA